MSAKALSPAGMVRVLYVEHNTDGSVGGSHYALLDIVRNLDRSRFEPVVLFFEEHALLQAFRETGAQIIVGRPGRGPLTLGSTIPLPPGLRRFVQSALNAVRLLTSQTVSWIRLLRTVRPSLVHLNNSFNADHDLIAAAVILRIPCVAHQRGFAGITGPSELMFARGIAAIVAISTAIHDDVLARGVDPRRVRLIHDGIEPDRVVPKQSPAEIMSAVGLQPADRIIGMVGNVKPWKGQHVLIGALARLHAKYPNLHCLFVGTIVDVNYHRELEALAASGGVTDHAHFVGFSSNPADFMNVMEAVVHASIDPEPFGLVVVEAMALSKPVISTTVGGPRDVVIEGVTGYLCPPGDSVALAERLAGVLENCEKARMMGAEGRRRLLTSFTSAPQVRRIESLYDELVVR